MKSFAHLHNHSVYSILDGAAKIADMVAAAKADGQPAVSVTEHGNLYSAIELYKECKKQGDIKPIMGEEFYMVPDRLERTSLRRNSHNNDFKSRYHLTVLAENNKGWQNLIKLSSDSYLEGFYQKPRADWDSLERYAEGLIVTSGCLGGVVLQNLLNDDYKGALEAARRLQDIFGKDNFFIELQDHGLLEQAKTNPQLIDISKNIGAPLVATNDIHYVKHSDSVPHDILLCCQTGSKLSDANRFKFQSDQHYLKTAQEMRYLFREVEDACDNTLLIAERCNVSIDFDTLHLPVFPVPEGYESPIEYLTHLAHAGFKEKYPNPSEEAIERLKYELGVINSLNLSSYFLIVWDLLQYAKQENILCGPGRGSAAGSIVSYCIGITAPEPLRYGLIFERFIDPNRVALADIDLDFDTRYRDQLINYVKHKYGDDHVAQIITFSIIKARNAVRDAARVLSYPPEVSDKLSKAMPELMMGEDTPLWACFEETERYKVGYQKADQLRAMYASDPVAKEVCDAALGIEGGVRQDGIHAAAVVIGDRPLNEIVPTQRRGEDAPVVTQWHKDTIEELGLLKMDFLGLRNLDVIADTYQLLRREPDFNDIPLDDPKVFQLLQSGYTTGIFQMESQGMRKLLRRLRPTTIEDLSAVIALYRPGPMAEDMHNQYADRKNGRSPVDYFHEDAKELLDETFGLAIYQEEIMEIARKFAGYSMSEADALRKIMGKKLVDQMIAERDKFVSGCINTGYNEAFANKLFDMIEGFARYSFNKCLTGDTVVSTGGQNRYNTTWTLRDIYDRVYNVLPPTPSGRYKGPKYDGPCIRCGKQDSPRMTRGLCEGCNAWRSKFMAGKFRVLAYDNDGRIRPQPVKDIHYNGVRPVFKITLANGMSIKSTGNHRHMTPKGWVETDQLVVGDSLLTCGDYEYTQYNYRLSVGERQKVGSVNKAFGSANYGYIDGAHSKLEEWTRSIVEWACQFCGNKDARLERAHLDGNRNNNKLENLRLLCVSCHKKFDYQNNGRQVAWQKGRPARAYQIESIEYIGEEPVYDLEMATESHNFVANGIITHNSHSISYAFIGYWTAYLKAHYPKEYMAALCGSVVDDIERCAVFLHEARRMGINVLTPDINKSEAYFSVVEEGIIVGLAAIKGLGSEKAQEIISEREKNGPYTSLINFIERTDPNIKVLDALCWAGALDEYGSRLGIVSVSDNILSKYRKAKKKGLYGVEEEPTLFNSEEYWDVEIPTKEYSESMKLAEEKRILGLYISGHPLYQFPQHQTDSLIADLATTEENFVEVLTVISKVEVKKTRKGDRMAILTLEDPTGAIESPVFPQMFSKVEGMFSEGDIGIVYLKVGTDREGQRNFIYNGFDKISVDEEPVGNSFLNIYLPRGFAQDEKMVSRLKGLFLSHHGKSPVTLYVGKQTKVKLPHDFTVTKSDELLEDVNNVFIEFNTK